MSKAENRHRHRFDARRTASPTSRREWIASHRERRATTSTSRSSTCGTIRCRSSTRSRSPAWAPSQNEVAQRWQKKVASLDGFIFTAAEYNRGPTAVLKNALDYAYKEWNQKPVAFVGYGGVGGARAVEQLRLHAVELQMAPIRTAVHILWADMLPVMQRRARSSPISSI